MILYDEVVCSVKYGVVIIASCLGSVVVAVVAMTKWNCFGRFQR